MVEIKTLLEESSETSSRSLSVQIEISDGEIWIKPQGYSDPNDRLGWPIGLKLNKGRLTLIAYNEVNKDPTIIDMEGAKRTI